MKQFNQIILGQLLGDAHLEKVRVNARLTFSFGQSSLDYANWIHDLFKDYCNQPVYSVKVTTKGKVYTNYRLKTRTNQIFTEYHDLFYKIEQSTKRYRKTVPESIVIDPIVLAHFIIGDGNAHKDGRIRIYTNQYTYSECHYLRNSILKHCGIPCEVILDRISLHSGSQYILTFPREERSNLQKLLAVYMHSSMRYRIGLLFSNNVKVLSPNKTGWIAGISLCLI